MCKNLVRTQLTRTTTAIDWSQVMCENGDSPEKFSGKNEAIRHARCRRIVYDSIEQVQFRYETA
ncbi:hypothetical protein [Chamaesiphon sp.]|uniref:hypothetical protein n=1 Tax=Chamaesiphon sp. TaxID=2814140 RepID=UPI0035944FE1